MKYLNFSFFVGLKGSKNPFKKDLFFNSIRNFLFKKESNGINHKQNFLFFSNFSFNYMIFICLFICIQISFCDPFLDVISYMVLSIDSDVQDIAGHPAAKSIVGLKSEDNCNTGKIETVGAVEEVVAQV